MSTRRDFLGQTLASVALATSAHDISIAKSTYDEAFASDAGRNGGNNGIVNLAILGVGDISPRYFKQVSASTRARFVATCARTLESAKRRAVEYGIKAWYDDYTEMYDVVKPDGVVIATPHSAHAAPTIAALERDISVLCEKPMATSWEECKAMVKAAEKSSAVFLALPFDAVPPYLTALEYLNQATLGVFMGAEAQMLLPKKYMDNILKLKDWYYRRSVAGGWMLTATVYPVSRLVGMLGPAQRVSAFVNTLLPHRIREQNRVIESDIDDNVSLLIEWKGGQQALVRTLDGTSILRNDTVVYGRRGTLWLSGDDVVIHSPERAIPGAEVVTWNGQKDCYRVPIKGGRENEGLIEHFVDCIKGLSRPTCGGQQQLHVHEILFKGYEATLSGKVQELETTFTPWHRVEPEFHDTRSRPV